MVIAPLLVVYVNWACAAGAARNSNARRETRVLCIIGKAMASTLMGTAGFGLTVAVRRLLITVAVGHGDDGNGQETARDESDISPVGIRRQWRKSGPGCHSNAQNYFELTPTYLQTKSGGDKYHGPGRDPDRTMRHFPNRL